MLGGGAAVKSGTGESRMLPGHSAIVTRTGEIVAMSRTLEDEVVAADCDLGHCREIREHSFNFALHRQPQHYRGLT